MVIDLAVGTINLNNVVQVPASNQRTGKNKGELQLKLRMKNCVDELDEKLGFHCGSHKAVVLHVS